jgi:hypothetical protein
MKMKPIQGALKEIDGHLLSITRNTDTGCYELEVGIPNTWVYEETHEVGCEVTNEAEMGKLIRVYPKKHDVVIDDLIDFVRLIMSTNKLIADKEKKFEEKFRKVKEDLENDAKKFYEELEEMKKDSFKNLKAAEKKEKKEKKQEILEIEPELQTNKAIESLPE